jgi:hypothetical protein
MHIDACHKITDIPPGLVKGWALGVEALVVVIVVVVVVIGVGGRRWQTACVGGADSGR